MNEKYEKLFRFIVDTDKECSAELLHALKSLKANFDNALTITKKQIQLSTEKNSFDDISQIAESCQQISEISIRIENAIALMEVKPSNKEIVFEGNANIEKKFHQENQLIMPTSMLTIWNRIPWMRILNTRRSAGLKSTE